jgi:hypothetical protein
MLLAAGAGFLLRGARAATVQPPVDTIEGHLIQLEDGRVVLQAGDGGKVQLSGDEGTGKVIHDPRLGGVELVALGHFTAPGRFAIGPIFEKNMFVVKNGKRLRITYWCDICSIRTYAPGPCVCCQKWTDLDLRDPNLE